MVATVWADRLCLCMIAFPPPCPPPPGPGMLISLYPEKDNSSLGVFVSQVSVRARMLTSCSITASSMRSTLFLVDWLFRSAAVKHVPWNLMGLGTEVVRYFYVGTLGRNICNVRAVSVASDHHCDRRRQGIVGILHQFRGSRDRV